MDELDAEVGFSLLPNETIFRPSSPDAVDYPKILPRCAAAGFQMQSHNHAAAILRGDFPESLDTIDAILSRLAISAESLVRGGGGEHELTQWIRNQFKDAGWPKHEFVVTKLIDGEPLESVTHEIDHVRNDRNGTIALEVEWNNKDPFFDRDLENFKRLHSERVISLGIVVTKSEALHAGMKSIISSFAERNNIDSFEAVSRFDLEPTSRQRGAVMKRIARRNVPFSEAWSHVFVQDKYGQSTTNWSKLHTRVSRGVGNPCPLLLLGIPLSAVR